MSAAGDEPGSAGGGASQELGTPEPRSIDASAQPSGSLAPQPCPPAERAEPKGPEKKVFALFDKDARMAQASASAAVSRHLLMQKK